MILRGFAANFYRPIFISCLGVVASTCVASWTPAVARIKQLVRNQACSLVMTFTPVQPRSTALLVELKCIDANILKKLLSSDAEESST